MDSDKELMKALLALGELLTVESEARSLVRDLIEATVDKRLPPLSTVALNTIASRILQISSHILEIHRTSSVYVSNAIGELISKPVEPDKKQVGASIEDVDISELSFSNGVLNRLHRVRIYKTSQLAALIDKEGIIGLQNLPTWGYTKWQFGPQTALDIVRIFNQWRKEREKTKGAQDLNAHAEITGEVPTAYSYETHPAEESGEEQRGESEAQSS